MEGSSGLADLNVSDIRRLLWGFPGTAMLVGLEMFAFFLATLVVRSLRGERS